MIELPEINDMTTWRSLLLNALSQNEEVWEDIIQLEIGLVNKEPHYRKDVDYLLDYKFRYSHGYDNPFEFKAWTKNYVYMSHNYDSLEEILYIFLEIRQRRRFPYIGI